MNKAIEKFTADVEEIAEKLKDYADVLLLNIGYLKEAEKMNNKPAGDSRDPNLLTDYMKERWLLLSERYSKLYSPKRLILTCTHRSPAKQFELFCKGRLFGKIVFPSKIVTNVDGLQKIGKHNQSPAQAFDVAVILDKKVLWADEEYLPIGEIGEKLGLVWGGRFNLGNGRHDYPHFEQPNEV